MSNQNEIDERFKANLIGKVLVSFGIYLNKFFKAVLPKKILIHINNSFKLKDNYNVADSIDGIRPSFDKLRASLNLVIAAILISIATSYKLPLSTTYVTFMVAMGTSLSDRAWSSESAIYRVSGVVSVIGGWFLTALSAFMICGLIYETIFYPQKHIAEGTSMPMFFDDTNEESKIAAGSMTQYIYSKGNDKLKQLDKKLRKARKKFS